MSELARVNAEEGKPTFKRNFQAFRFIGGNLVSFFGDQIYLIALPLMVLALTGSPLSMGIVAALERIPVLLQPLMGVLTDRFDRKRILLLCDFIRFLIIGTLGVVYLLGMLPIWGIYIGAFIVGVLGQVYNTSQFASIPKLVRSEDLPLVNSLNTGIFHTGVFLAPGLGGLIVSLYNPGVALLINSGSFFVGFLMVWTLNIESPRIQVGRPSLMKDMKEGFNYVIQQKPILYTNLGMFFSIFGTTLFLTMMVVHLKSTVSFTAVQIGWVLSIGGGGAMVGSMMAAILRKKFSYRQLLFNAGVIGGISIILFSLTHSFYWLAIMNAVGTMCAAIQSPCIVTIRQNLTPDYLLGRVQATSRFMTWSLMPVAAFAAGLIGEYIGTGVTIWAGGAVATAASFIYLHPSLNRRVIEQE
ncbi:MFS transporter [Halobacillus sp. H74]|uniref:MFS transporter n=1 Tax=Halobacillus sp. H74 TaxID=3457436 RepID=UPI003FCC76A9